jgi:anti-sigma factor RsiW
MTNEPITDAVLNAYVDGRLAHERRAEVEAYLSGHPDEAARIGDYKKQNELLHKRFDPVLEEPMPERLRIPHGKGGWPALKIAAMVGWLALGSVIGWSVNEFAGADDADRITLARQAAVAHLVYAPEPKRAVEVGADQEQAMVSWLSKRIGVQVTLPRLADQGYQLLGGRLLPGEMGPACQIMYQASDGKRVTLYMTTTPDEEIGRSVRVVEQGKLQVALWRDSKLGYALSGEADKKTISRLADAAHRQLSL